MQHHTNFCKWIHGVFVLFDHALKTNLKAVCIVFLYFTDGALIKFPIDFRIFYKEVNKMPWRRHQQSEHQTKYTLAIEMLERALKKGFPKCIVLADSWFGIEPFFKELRLLGLSYVIEIKNNYTIRIQCRQPKLTPKGRLAKKQYDLKSLPEFFGSVPTVINCGFAYDKESGKESKILYRTKIAAVSLNAVTGKHRVVESIDADTDTVRYLVTDQLSWESSKIISAYGHRWVIEEFFRNAKQLSDMEGATVRSKQGVTASLCLVSYIDFLLHFESYRQSTAGDLTKESLTIPSIVRQAQYENLTNFIERLEKDKGLIKKWFAVEKERVERKRKPQYQLIAIDEYGKDQFNPAG